MAELPLPRLKEHAAILGMGHNFRPAISLPGADPITTPVMLTSQPRFSVVVAVYNEADNVTAVTEEILRAVAPVGPFELIYVDDGSDDATAERLRVLRDTDPSIRVLRHDRRCGKTAALITGVLAAGSPWIVTMDGDGQDSAEDVPRLLELAWANGEPFPLVAGIRTRRRDSWSRRFATKFANGLRQALLHDNCPDTACGLKVFRRDTFLRLPAFEGMHRFLPALFQTFGNLLVCCPVTHRPRLAGQSKYTNFGRAVVGLFDTLGVIWLRRRTRLPQRVVEE
jgi:dolichol-phosphate mannosyltransferase